MSVEAVVEELKREFAAFKTANDNRLQEIEEHGSVAPELQAKVDEANSNISTLQERLKEESDKSEERIRTLEDQMNRGHIGGRGFRVDNESLERYANWQTGVDVRNKRRGLAEPVEPQDIDPEQVRTYRRDFFNWIRTGQPTNEMSVGSDPDGGYWVDPDTTGRIVAFINETSPVRRLASVQPISTDALEGEVDLASAADGWVGETESRPETSTPTVAEWRIPLREQYANPFLTQRIIDFANRDVEAWLENKVRQVFARSEATAFVTGDGAKRPRGFTTYSDGTPGNTVATWPFVEQVASGAAAALTADGLINLAFSMKSAHARSATFGMRRDTERQVRELKDGNGAYLWQPDFTQRSQGLVLGSPVAEMADMPAVAAAALAIVFANFAEAYQIVDSTIGLRVVRDNVTTPGKVKLYTTRYVGGDLVNFEAIKIQDIAAS